MITLQSPISSLIRIRPEIAVGLKRLNLHTVEDILRYFPVRYSDAREYISIAHAEDGQEATFCGTIKKIETKKSFTSKIPMAEATIEDTSGTLKIIWFNQAYFGKMYAVGQTIEVTGKIQIKNGTRTLINPNLRERSLLPIDSHDSLFASNSNTTVLTPLYAETRHVSSRWISLVISRALSELGSIEDPIPEILLKKYSLPSLWSAYIWIHSPKHPDDAQKARKRFAFEEIFTIQLQKFNDRQKVQEQRAYHIEVDESHLKDFLKKLPYDMTQGQKDAVATILGDIQKEYPMSRLLEGDVGSGKTAIAAAATYVTVMNRPNKNGTRQSFGNLQVAYMAPTEILATQHFESFIEYFRDTGISVALITGSGCRKFPSKVASQRDNWTSISKAQLSKWIANGEIPVVIGTHALIQKSLTFKHLALAIIDEQHRFGLKQRKGLAKKDDHAPHLLSMSATPIPRTLALTMYGDLDISVLNELPPGRQHPHTEVILPEKRKELYEKVREQLRSGKQAYVICPRIDEADPTLQKTLQIRSVLQEEKVLQETIFPEFVVRSIHSRMTKQKKEDVMMEFKHKKIDILVSTSVIEVGVNVPNATIMIIEGAERFGLAQLHQLRGRVMRSSDKPYCYLFTDSKSDKTKERLSVFTKAKNGFELAEYDLSLRGSGTLIGTKQWGISDIAMEALRNPKLVEAAREEARLLVKSGTLASHPLLLAKINALEQTHME
jgi:ATP-dependent DNA helicase RecG